MSGAGRGDDLGDRMKWYESATDMRLDPSMPICARIDGRSFSRFTKGMARPYDSNMSSAMIETACGLVDKTHACIGYTQSDEINLVFWGARPESNVIFGARLLKLSSVLASLATALFMRRIMTDKSFENYRDRLPHFDCRVWQVPSISEAANVFVWRYQDARKNAISMAARSHFSHKALQNKSGPEMLSMMAAKGVDFEAYPGFFKHGTFVKRESVMRSLTADEIQHIPEKHRPRWPVLRTRVAPVDGGNFMSVDRVAFILPTQPDYAR